MKYNIIIISCLLILFFQNIFGHFSSVFSQNNTIAYPETGLFLRYVGVYTPPDVVIHNSAIFPMTLETCHFLPANAFIKIPACNSANKRNKRSISDIVSLGLGFFSLGTSVLNSILTANLYKQVAVVEKSLEDYSKTLQVHGVHLAKIQENQIELGEQLYFTQKALNATISIIDAHGQELTALKNDINKIYTRFQRSFLYLAMTQILRNELTLDFLSPDDLQDVVFDVWNRGNLTFNDQYGSLSLVQIVTNLLLRQQFDFVPSSEYTATDPHEIGRLIVTSYFAIPQRHDTSFYIYKLLAIPFFHQNKTIQLAQVSKYWALNPVDNTTIEWYDPEESGCNLDLMTSCRSTPPIQPLSNKTCFGQIFGGLPLSDCHTIPVPPSPFFLRQLRDNLWITSSSEPLHCLKIAKREYPILRQQTWNLNEQLTLAPVALLNVTPGYTIACPGYTLVGNPIFPKTPSLMIFYNNSLLANNISVINVYQYLKENTSWFNPKSSEKGIQSIIKRMRELGTVPINELYHPQNMWAFGTSTISYILLGLIPIISVGFYCVCRYKGKRIIVRGV